MFARGLRRAGPSAWRGASRGWLSSSYNQRSFTSTLPQRSYSTDSGIDDLNVGKKRELSAASVDEGSSYASVLTTNQQGLQGETSLATTGVKNQNWNFAVKHQRLKATPVGARYDPLYAVLSYNQGPHSVTAEGSPGGFGLFSALAGLPLPYGKLTAATKLPSGIQIALSTGYPFINVVPSASRVEGPTATSPEAVTVPPAETATLTQEPSDEAADAEIRHTKALYEGASGYDPLSRS